MAVPVVVPPPAVVDPPSTPDQGPGNTDPPAGRELGLKITAVREGAPVGETLRVGDIILTANGQATATVEDLSAIAASAVGDVDVVFINGENGRRKSVTLYPRNGRFGITVESVEIE